MNTEDRSEQNAARLRCVDLTLRNILISLSILQMLRESDVNRIRILVACVNFSKIKMEASFFIEFAPE